MFIFCEVCSLVIPIGITHELKAVATAPGSVMNGGDTFMPIGTFV